MRFLALTLLFLSLALMPAAAGVPFQRMVLAPGCYVLEPHSFTDVSAFCLDEEMPAPGHGVQLASVPDALGDTFLTVNGKKVGLEAALEQHLVRMEGLGGTDYFHVRIRNVTDKRIEICINAPTVVMGNSGYPTADITKIYGEIVRVLPKASDAPKSTATNSDNAELEAALALQKKLWEITERERNREADHLEDPIESKPGSSDKPATAPKDCSSQTGVLVCSGN